MFKQFAGGYLFLLSHSGNAQRPFVKSFLSFLAPPSFPPIQGLKEAHRAGQGSLLFSMAYIAKSFYDLSAISLDGEKIDFNTFRGRAVLIENVASL